MKKVYLLRHGEKDPEGVLTKFGEKSSRKLGSVLPTFDKVISSSSSRTRETAKLLARIPPTVDSRAGFYMATAKKSDALNALAVKGNISFLEAVKKFSDEEVLAGVKAKASELNKLIDECLHNSEVDTTLIVSHDLSISPAMSQRHMPFKSIDFLSGYIINEIGAVTEFNP